MKYNFGFGDSFAVSDSAFETFRFLANSVQNFHPTYPPVTGFPHLNDKTKQIVKVLTGQNYKHVLITHGATGAVNLILRYLDPSVHNETVITDENYFIFYPQMISRAGFIMKNDKALLETNSEAIHLTAVPSNPCGEMDITGTSERRTIWDACYFSPIYMNTKLSPEAYVPKHRAMVGSFGKLLGINGARLGWIATNDTEMYERLVWDQAVDTMGVSTLGCSLIENLLGEGMSGDAFKMQIFFASARNKINNNREALRRLEKFGSNPVPENGMFWFTSMDEKARSLLEKTGVKVIDGTECGGQKGSVRITLGQTPELTGQMVRAVLTMDRRQK